MLVLPPPIWAVPKLKEESQVLGLESEGKKSLDQHNEGQGPLLLTFIVPNGNGIINTIMCD